MIRKRNKKRNPNQTKTNKQTNQTQPWLSWALAEKLNFSVSNGIEGTPIPEHPHEISLCAPTGWWQGPERQCHRTASTARKRERKVRSEMKISLVISF